LLTVDRYHAIRGKCTGRRVAEPIRFSTALLLAGTVAWTAAAVPGADTQAALNETPKPENDVATKPSDRSCYVRQADGLVRYYLDGPLRDGELAYLQGQPITGPDGKPVVRTEVPRSDIPPRILRAPPCPPGKHHLS
jgi:hypothetical protein